MISLTRMVVIALLVAIFPQVGLAAEDGAPLTPWDAVPGRGRDRNRTPATVPGQQPVLNPVPGQGGGNPIITPRREGNANRDLLNDNLREQIERMSRNAAFPVIITPNSGLKQSRRRMRLKQKHRQKKLRQRYKNAPSTRTRIPRI